MQVAGDAFPVLQQRHPSEPLLAFTHVADGGDRFDHVVHQNGAQADLDRKHAAVSVLGQQAQVGAHGSTLRMCDVPLPMTLVPMTLFGRHELLDAHSDEHVGGISEDPRRGPIREQDRAIVGHQKEPVWRRIQQRFGHRRIGQSV